LILFREGKNWRVGRREGKKIRLAGGEQVVRPKQKDLYGTALPGVGTFTNQEVVQIHMTLAGDSHRRLTGDRDRVERVGTQTQGKFINILPVPKCSSPDDPGQKKI